MAQVLHLLYQYAVLLTVGHQGCQHLHLLLGFEHGLVGAIQVIKMANQCLNAHSNVKRFQHVAAHKVGQITDRFHGDGLVEKFQRLIVFYAKTPPEPRCIGRKTVKQFGAWCTQFFAQSADISAKICKMGRNGQTPVGHHKEACRLGLCVFHPEHLRQRHSLVVARIVKYAQNHRVTVVVAQ